MRRRILVGLIGGLLVTILACSKQAPDKKDEQAKLGPKADPAEAKALPPLLIPGDPAAGGEALPPPRPLDATPAGPSPLGKEPPAAEAAAAGPTEKDAEDAARQANHDAALAEGLKLLAERKTAEALEAFETARTFRDSDFIRDEIARLKLRIDQDAVARKTVNDIETVLDQGKGAEAAELAQAALKEFGDSEYADKLVKLKLQADALQAAQKDEGATARHQRFRSEGEAALKEKNLRAAALAFEQALVARHDAELRQQLDEVRGALDRYDALRRKAAELRADPNNLEDAVLALQDAAKIWDTLQVRQEIDEYSLALRSRRDRVSVAGFEVHGDVGIADAGSTIAEEVLPHLKARFDLVEREQIDKIIAELKLEGPPLEPEPQRELGRLAKIRYLVVGSVTPLGGIAVNARLIDVQTGLVVQTAKVVAPTPEELMPLLAELGKQLLMSDDEKIAYERERAKRVQVFALPPPDAPLPPPPEILPFGQAAPRPILIDNPVPPDFGGLRPGDFQRLPLAPALGQPVPVPVAGGEVELVVQQRLLQVSLSLGDNLFRRGRYREAQRHFDLALLLAPGHVDVRVRLERLRPLLPPPPVVVVPVVIEQPVLIVRPRVAFLNFVVAGNPLVVPPYLSTWTPLNLAPYFSPAYDVVDPGEVYWYMAQMGMTLRDLMENPFARRWLGRALNVRYFVFGAIEQTASFDVSTYLVDTEYGFVQTQARLHVRNPLELKFRLGELASLTQMDPLARNRYLAEQQRFDALLLDAQRRAANREFPLAINLYQDALRLRPNHVQVLAELNLWRRRAEELAWQDARAQAFALEQARAAELQRRQFELAQAAERARIAAAQYAAAAENRRLIEQQRLLAQAQIVKDARFYLKMGKFAVGISRFESAVALAPTNDDLVRELAVVRAVAERQSRLEAVNTAAARESALRQEQQRELAVAREKIAQEQARRLAAEQGARKAREQRDQVAYQSAFDEGRRLMSTGNHDGALAALGAASRIRRTPEVETLLNQALVENGRATAKTKGEAERLALERQLTDEKSHREQAQTQAKRNHDLYVDALKSADKALAARNYTAARAKFEEAGKMYRTDAVLTGLRQVEAAQTQATAQTKAAEQKGIEQQQKTERVRQLLAQGQSALDAKQYAAAVKTLRQAKSLAPDNVDVLAALTKAEQGQDKTQAEARRVTEDKNRQANFRRLTDSAKANFENKQYNAAKSALTQALVLQPGDPEATGALRAVEKALSGAGQDAKAKAESERKATAYEKHMADGRLALSTQRYDDAVKSFTAAQSVLPGDKASQGFLQEAQKARTDAANAAALEVKQRAAEKQRAVDVAKALGDGRAALAAKNLEGAAKAFNAAAGLAPQDPSVIRALDDLRQAQKTAQADAEAQQKRQAQYQTLINGGKAALAAKRYAEAQKAYGEALKLVPNDATAQRGLQEAGRALEASRPNPPADPAKADPAAQYQKAMQNAAALDKQQKFAEALQAYQDALKHRPNDTKATQGARNADFNNHLAEGQKHLQARRFPEAVREFEAALRIMPGNATATNLLNRAKQAKN